MIKILVSYSFLILVVGFPLAFPAPAENHATTVKEALLANGIKDFRSYPEYFLKEKLENKETTQGFFHVGYHINPSAEGLIVFSKNLKRMNELEGWELLTFPNEVILFQENEIHFAPTHSLRLSIFDPKTGKAKRIYPPAPEQQIRLDFTQKVAKAYQKRGSDWFKQHNYPMEPEKFDVELQAKVTHDLAQKTISFSVRFGNSFAPPEESPIDFHQDVKVICKRTDSFLDLKCTEY